MPAFNLPKIEDFSEIEPVFTDPKAGAQGGGGTAAAQPRKPKNRAQMEARFENSMGPLKPLGQLMNTLASPDTKAGIFVGPVNAISKLGNAVGDWAQGKPIDTRDAWVVPDKVVRQLNPFRMGAFGGQEVTPADTAGLQVGGAIGAEIMGAAVGLPAVKALGRLAGLKRVADAARATEAVRAFSVAQRANQSLGLATRVVANAGEALTSTALATPFLDVSQGNLANVGDAFGLKLPGRVDENDNYLQAFGKTVAVEGIAAPLAAMGALSFIRPLRRAMFGEPVRWLEDLADAELEPYTRPPQPQLPPASSPAQLPSVQMQAAADGSPITPVNVSVDEPGGALPGTSPGLPQLPSYEQRGGPLVHGSAIERWYEEATQIRQVQEQRQRLLDAGLLRQGEGGQLELNIAEGVDPEIEQQIRQLQAERGGLLQRLSQEPEAADDISKQLAEIDKEITDLSLNDAPGTSDRLGAPRGSRQLEMNLDTRPELDTFLANLDELSDSQLRDIHSRVVREIGAERNAQELTATQQRVEALTQRLDEINSRLAAEEITPRGAKGMITRTQREIQAAEQQLRVIQQRMAVPETTVGQQLEMTMAWQTGLDLSPQPEVSSFGRLATIPENGNYRTIDEYRSVLEGTSRDTLRRLSMPYSSPEVAALVKIRTGRRVWNAKKADIVDALVEIAMRRRQYLPREVTQFDLPLKTNLAGEADAPLLDVPADLSTTSRMEQTVDADGNPITVPMAEYQPRGMDPQTRERIKAEILRRAIDNGEVQAPITPIPNRPYGPTSFNQGTFIDDLLSDETGQMAMQFLNDELPPYKAGGKNADALIDEMRLRFEYNILDAKAQQAQKDALMAAHGWDELSWDDKKRLGMMGRGMFAFSRDELPAAVDQVRPPTPQFDPTMAAPGERAAQPYRGQGSVLEQNVPQFTPELKPKPERKPQTYDTETVYASINGEMRPVTRAQAQAADTASPAAGTALPKGKGKGKGKGTRTPAQEQAAQRIAAREAQRNQLRRDLDDLHKQHNGGSC